MRTSTTAPPTAPRRAPPRRPRRRRLHRPPPRPRRRTRPRRRRGARRRALRPAAGRRYAADRQPLPPHLTAEILSEAEPLPACRRLRITVKDLQATGVHIDAAADSPGQLTIRFPEPDATAPAPTREAATVDSHTLALLNSVATQEILETDAGPMRILHITADPRHELMAGTTRAGEAHPHLALRDPTSDRILAVSTTCVVLDTHTEWPDDRKEAYIAMRKEMASTHARAEALQRELDKQQTRKRAREDDDAADGVGGAVAGSQLLDQLLDLVDARRRPPTRAPTSARGRRRRRTAATTTTRRRPRLIRKTATTTRRRTCSDGTHTHARAHAHPDHASGGGGWVVGWVGERRGRCVCQSESKTRGCFETKKQHPRPSDTTRRSRLDPDHRQVRAAGVCGLLLLLHTSKRITHILS